MLSKLFEYFEQCSVDNHNSTQHKLLLTSFALNDIVGNKCGKELDKLVTDLITFAGGYNLVKQQSEVMQTRDHKITFHKNNTYTIEPLHLY